MRSFFDLDESQNDESGYFQGRITGRTYISNVFAYKPPN